MGHIAHAAPVALGIYKPRRPQASPLFRLVQDHLHRLQTVYDERFAREYGPWRPVVGEVTDKFLACGILEHGFARIRCDACAREYLLAFSCKCRYFCPSCHAKRLAIWAQWLDTTLLATRKTECVHFQRRTPFRFNYPWGKHKNGERRRHAPMMPIPTIVAAFILDTLGRR
jgi:hypothetical protein